MINTKKKLELYGKMPNTSKNVEKFGKNREGFFSLLEKLFKFSYIS